MLKILSLFSGIGAFEKALTRQNIEYEVINYCEIDKYASKSYSVIHNEPESKNLGDITKVNEKELQDFDLMTWGFPCTDISVAGRQKGMIDENGDKTRSGLYYEGLRILQCKKPKYSIIENVKNLTSKKFQLQFKQILNDLEDAGYNNYYQILNAKNYGIPQNRERVFIISIREDVDDGKFQFPEPFDNGLRLKDFLETEVDKKYYTAQDKADKLIATLKDKIVTGQYNQKDAVAIQKDHEKLKIKEDDICSCIDANYWKGIDNHASRTGILQLGNLMPSGDKNNSVPGGVYDPNGISPCLRTPTGGQTQPIIVEPQILRYERTGQSNTITSVEKDNYVLEPSLENMCIDDRDKGYGIKASEIIPTQRALRSGLKVYQNYRIRKLTPKECWRLMGFDDEDINKCIEAGISNSQLYKQAGNSIVVNVLEEIFKKLFKNIINKIYYSF